MQADACAPGSSEAAQAFAAERDLPYFETSARDYESVEPAIHQILLPGVVCFKEWASRRQKGGLGISAAGLLQKGWGFGVWLCRATWLGVLKSKEMSGLNSPCKLPDLILSLSTPKTLNPSKPL